MSNKCSHDMHTEATRIKSDQDRKVLKIIITNSARKFIGEAAHCLALIEQLIRAGHEPILVARRGFELEKRARAHGVNVVSLEFGSGFSLMSDMRDTHALAALIRTERPDVLHCHRGKDHWLAVGALALSGSPKPALVRTRHVVVPVQGHVANKWLFGRRTHRLIAVSGKAGETFGPLLPGVRKRLSVVYSAVDQERFRPTRRSSEWRKSFGIPEDAPLVGLIARFQNIKGQHVLLKAAPEILKSVPGAHFLMAGNETPGKHAGARRRAQELGISDRVHIHGWLPDVETAIASLDAGVVASLGSEGSSRIVLEYMASGVPVVATMVGGIPELVEDLNTGVLIPPGDVGALSRAVTRVLTDSDLIKGLRRRGLEKVRRNHTFERWLEDTLSVYREALADLHGNGGAAA